MKGITGRILGKGVAGLAMACLMLGAGTAGAQNPVKTNKVLSGLSAQEIISILTENQIQSQIEPRSGTDPLIYAQMPSGAKFFVRLQNCGPNGSNCQVLQYGAIFVGAELTGADFNQFNSSYAFGKTYHGKSKELYIEHAVSVAGGIHRAAVEVNMFVFFSVADLFTKFLMERKDSVSASLNKKGAKVANAAGPLPVNGTLASFSEAVAKNPKIVNKVHKGKLASWNVK